MVQFEYLENELSGWLIVRRLMFDSVVGRTRMSSLDQKKQSLYYYEENYNESRPICYNNSHIVNSIFSKWIATPNNDLTHRRKMFGNVKKLLFLMSGYY